MKKALIMSKIFDFQPATLMGSTSLNSRYNRISRPHQKQTFNERLSGKKLDNFCTAKHTVREVN